MNTDKKMFEMVLCALFVAIIVIMAFTPLGYIPLFVINATIIHIPVILGSLFCGPKKGAFLGFVFGFTSFIKNTFMPATLSAFVFSPVLAMDVAGTVGVFKSIFICFVPRILVGVVPYFVYILVRKALESEKRTVWGTVLNGMICLFFYVGIYAFLEKKIESLDINIRIAAAIVISVAVFTFIEFAFIKKNAQMIPFVYAAISGALVNTLLVMGGIFVLYKDAYATALSIETGAVLGVISGIISFNGVIEAIVGAVIVYAVGLVLMKISPIGARTEE